MTVRYTSLRVVPAGVILYAQHRERLGPEHQAAFDHFAVSAAPGAYALLARDGALEVTPRGPSRLFDHIPTRRRPSPLPPGRGPQPKAPAPGPYDAVRAPGVATLLTDEGETEVYESCSAAVLAWDGKTLVATPDDRSRVASTAERAILARLGFRRAPLLLAEGWPIVLVNALALTAVPEGSAFPAGVRAQLDEILGSTTRRS
jgi:hypothetical protein